MYIYRKFCFAPTFQIRVPWAAGHHGPPEKGLHRCTYSPQNSPRCRILCIGCSVATKMTPGVKIRSILRPSLMQSRVIWIARQVDGMPTLVSTLPVRSAGGR